MNGQAAIRISDRHVLRTTPVNAVQDLDREQLAERSSYVAYLCALVDANDIRANCELEHFDYLCALRHERARSRARVRRAAR